jgi:large subunit ribosomal protein L17
MRHRVKGRKLKRTASHRAALLNSLATSLLKHKRIKTTLAKAKEARGFVETIITKAKKNDLNSRRQVMRFIHDKEVVKELFNDIVPKIADRPGGYTRVIKLGNRIGDAASMAVLELVDYNEVINKKAEDNKENKETKKRSKQAKKEENEVEDANVVEETPAKKEKTETKAKKETAEKKEPKAKKETKTKKETTAKKEAKEKTEKKENKDKK